MYACLHVCMSATRMCTCSESHDIDIIMAMYMIALESVHLVFRARMEMDTWAWNRLIKLFTNPTGACRSSVFWFMISLHHFCNTCWRTLSSGTVGVSGRIPRLLPSTIPPSHRTQSSSIATVMSCNSVRRTACFHGSTVPAAAKRALSTTVLWFVCCWQKLVAAQSCLLVMAWYERTKE